jgi:hypothetical protein
LLEITARVRSSGARRSIARTAEGSVLSRTPEGVGEPGRLDLAREGLQLADPGAHRVGNGQPPEPLADVVLLLRVLRPEGRILPPAPLQELVGCQPLDRLTHPWRVGAQRLALRR